MKIGHDRGGDVPGAGVAASSRAWMLWPRVPGEGGQEGTEGEVVGKPGGQGEGGSVAQHTAHHSEPGASP